MYISNVFCIKNKCKEKSLANICFSGITSRPCCEKSEKKKPNGTKMVVTKEKDRLLLTSNLSIVCIPYSKILFLSNFSIVSLFIRKSKSVKMRGAYFHPSVSFFEEIQGDDLSEQ